MMESSIESFFHSNIIFPNDVKRRLNTIKTLDVKIEILKEKYLNLKAQLNRGLNDEEIFKNIEQTYISRSLNFKN